MTVLPEALETSNSFSHHTIIVIASWAMIRDASDLAGANGTPSRGPILH